MAAGETTAWWTGCFHGFKTVRQTSVTQVAGFVLIIISEQSAHKGFFFFFFKSGCWPERKAQRQMKSSSSFHGPLRRPAVFHFSHLHFHLNVVKLQSLSLCTGGRHPLLLTFQSDVQVLLCTY